MPASRRRSCGRCSSESISDPARTSKLKLSTRPAITASGRPKPARCLLRAGSAPEGGPPPGTCSMTVVGVTPATSTTGRTGRMHGEMPAKNPATMPTATSPTMTLSVLSPASHSLFGPGTGSVWSARQATSRSHGLGVNWPPNRANAWPALNRSRRRMPEARSGNTGNAVSMGGDVKGYRMVVVMPSGMSGERLAISRAFGAKVMTLGDFHVNDALAKVAELGRQPGYFAPQQFDSEWNVEENRTWLGPETLAQLPDGVVPDAVVGGVGTGGTILGVGQFFPAPTPSCPAP